MYECIFLLPPFERLPTGLFFNPSAKLLSNIRQSSTPGNNFNARIKTTKTSAIHPRLLQPSHSFYSVNFRGQMHIFLTPVIQSPVWPCFSPLAKLLWKGINFDVWLQLRCLDLNHQDERYPHMSRILPHILIIYFY